MRNLAATLMVVVLAAAGGCGTKATPTCTVSGVVCYQGKPLPLGQVVFMPAESGPMAGPAVIGKDGRYELKATAGAYAVGVTAMPERVGGKLDPNREGGIDWTGVPPVKSLVPLKYNRPDTSGISVDVEPKAGATLDINLP